MIHIATVHWELDDWVDIQLKYLNRFIHEPFRVYAYLNRLEHDHASKFFYSSTEDIESHAVKLNLLAERITGVAESDSDLLIFIDGDAFPIADVIAYGRKKLVEYSLVAVQRYENFGDIQPHPSFCLTTVGFWKEIGGDWRSGHPWKNLRGEEIRDVGGNLLKLLEEKQIAWHPMLRSNRVDRHPLFYGIYDDVVYHHGAGFRTPYCRLDAINDGKIYDYGNTGFVKRKWLHLKYKLNSRKTKRRNMQIADSVFDNIRSNGDFFLEFL